MSPFESDGVYAGIPYRVLPDCAIEAMMPGGLVKFKNMDHLVASASSAPAAIDAAHSIAPHDVLRNANLPGRPLDYYSLLQEAIQRTEKNSAQLRALVYERARFNLKRDILYGDSSAGLADLVRHINDFEHAVARIEADAEDQNGAVQGDSEDEPAHAPIGLDAAEEEPDFTSPPQAEVPAAPRSPSHNAVQISPRPLSPIYAGFNPVQRIDEFQRDRLEDFAPRIRYANRLIGILLLGIVFIAAVIGAGLLWRSSPVPPQVQTALPLPKAADAVAKQDSKAQDAAALKDETPKVTFPLPTSYGIYVLSDNKLTELEALPIAIPDPRVALSAELKIPVNKIISDNKPTFILFRRDLLNNAPQKIALRVIASMKRETKIVDGKAAVTQIEGAWRIRNISREFKVSPVPGQREMIMVRTDDSEPLPAGRYALVLNRVGYDFAVEGRAKSAESCLEGFETANGTVFTQCRTP